jgi:hypothetical protein
MMRPNVIADRIQDATSLLAALPQLDQRLADKVIAYVGGNWDPRAGDPGVPLSDTMFHGTRAEALKDADCAIDALVAGEPVVIRVRLQREARTAGYRRPWGRGT